MFAIPIQTLVFRMDFRSLTQPILSGNFAYLLYKTSKNIPEIIQNKKEKVINPIKLNHLSIDRTVNETKGLGKTKKKKGILLQTLFYLSFKTSFGYLCYVPYLPL